MVSKRLIWHLFPPYLAITLIALVILAWMTTTVFITFQLSQTQSDLVARTTLLVTLPELDLIRSTNEKVGALGRASRSRVTVIGTDGTVIRDSESDPSDMDNHSDRPEVREALAGRTGTAVRFSNTLGRDMVYVALPLQEEGRVVGVVRTSVPVKSVGDALGEVYWQVVLSTFLLAALSAGVSLLVARRMSRPLVTMRKGAERFAAGDLTQELPVSDTVEIGALAETMNKMAAQLDARIDTVTRQRNEREAILASMVEGVIAVDVRGRIISVNDAAAAMLEGVSAEAAGRTVDETIPIKELRLFVQQTLDEEGPPEADITSHGGDERYLQAHGAVLRDSNGNKMGAVVVLNDVTRLRRLERVRSDFVENVSHELRTPITSIKGFVENLRDGAVNDHQRASRFLEIVSRQADRLNAIIEDLLLLADVEKDSEAGGPPVELTRIAEILEEAIEDCGLAASENGIEVKAECPPDLSARVNAILVEQAVTNLVSNAIKYSDKGGEVRINASRRGADIAFEVADRGVGIASDQLPRLFERFYRVDKARSRKLGGTGLGLAIVKHIAEAHGGSVSVDSTPGEGSTFTILLPLRD